MSNEKDKETNGRRRVLGILLTKGLGSEDASTALRIAKAAREEGIEVRVFLMIDGVLNLQDKNFMEALKNGGAGEYSLCALNAQQRGVEKREGILFGSQYDLATIAHECDRFIAFN